MLGHLFTLALVLGWTLLGDSVAAYDLGDIVCVNADNTPILEFNPTPCGSCGVKNDCNSCCSDPCLLSPYIYQRSGQARMEMLRRFSFQLYNPYYNWFYDPLTTPSFSPCRAFKWANNGIDVTVLRVDSNLPICSTTRDIEDFMLFQHLASCPETLRSSYFLETTKRTSYATVIVSACQQIRIVVLSKRNDEFFPGFDCRLVWNPCHPCPVFSQTVTPDANDKQ